MNLTAWGSGRGEDDLAWLHRELDAGSDADHLVEPVVCASMG